MYIVWYITYDTGKKEGREFTESVNIHRAAGSASSDEGNTCEGEGRNGFNFYNRKVIDLYFISHVAIETVGLFWEATHICMEICDKI